MGVIQQLLALLSRLKDLLLFIIDEQRSTWLGVSYLLYYLGKGVNPSLCKLGNFVLVSFQTTFMGMDT